MWGSAASDSDEGGLLGGGFDLYPVEKLYDVTEEEIDQMMQELCDIDPHCEKLFSRKYIQYLMSKPSRKEEGVVRERQRYACLAASASRAARG